MTIELIPASPADAAILANLIELYAHDFSEFRELEIGDDGRFGYPPLPLYWSEPGRYPFLVRLDGKLAGLVLVMRSEAIWDMAEFFILRGCRRRGIGTRVAHEVWKRFPGPWEVRVLQANPAHRFWAEAVAAFVGKPVDPVLFEKDGVQWSLFAFENN